MSSFLIGLAVGAGLALLLAPRSGAETRRRFKRGAAQLRRVAEETVGNVAAEVGQTFETARRRVEEKLDEARGAFEKKKSQVERAMQAGREAAQEARGDLERKLAATKAAYRAGANVARESRAARRASTRESPRRA